MNPVNSKIIVSVNPNQKSSFHVAGIQMKSALNFETNYREKSPILATVIEGNDFLREGETLITHHNNFYLPSPYHLQDDIFSIPASVKTIFAKLLTDGTVQPVYGNLICKRIEIPTKIELPVEYRKTYLDRALVVDGGWTTFKKGQTVFTRPSACYDMIYYFQGKIHRVTKLDSQQICGLLLD